MIERDADGDPIIRVEGKPMSEEERKRWVAYFDDIDERESELERINQEDETSDD